MKYLKVLRYLLVLILIWLSFRSVADNFLKDPKLDSNYIEDYRHLLTARFYLLRESISFAIIPNEITSAIRYRPNSHVRIGVAGFYKWLGVGIAYRTPIIRPKQNELKGKSRIIDLRLNGYADAFASEITYQNYRSFYLSNPENIYEDWEKGDNYPQRKDLQIHTFSSIFYYILNYKKHSLKAAYLQNERQKKSSGSLIFGPAFIMLNISADSGLIPHNYMIKHQINEKLNLKDGKFYTLGSFIGYSYTLVLWKYFYFNVSIMPGFYYQNFRYYSQTDYYKGSQWSLLWIGRTSLGYNSDKWYIGLGGVTGFQSTPLPVGNADFNLDMSQLRFWIGTRFDIFSKKKKQ